MTTRTRLALVLFGTLLAAGCNANAQSSQPTDFLDPYPADQRAGAPAEGLAVA